jgi:hypothetical protein
MRGFVQTITGAIVVLRAYVLVKKSSGGRHALNARLRKRLLLRPRGNES